MTGVEGYIESAASGILAGINMAMALRQKPALILPADTMMGALAAYISDPTVTDFQPMGSNMGLFAALSGKNQGEGASVSDGGTARAGQSGKLFV